MKRTSNTRSDSSGIPNLNPKLMSWNASWSERTSVARAANSRSRSWRSDRSDVSSTTSESARTASSRRRSSAIELAMPRSSPSGWR